MPSDDPAPALFADFNQSFDEEGEPAKYPYRKTKDVTLKNVTISSGKQLRLSDNPVMFDGVRVRRIGDK